MNFIKVFFIKLSFIFLSHVAFTANFDERIEFPNFLGENVNFEDRESVSRRIFLIEKNLQALLNRIQMPHLDSGEIKTDEFFNHFLTHMRNLVPEDEHGQKKHELTLYISGGVVRTMLAYIYKYVYEQKNKCSDATYNKEYILNPCTTEYLLQKMHKEFLTKRTSTFVLGVGSDLDILYSLSPQNNDLEEKIKRTAVDFINSAEKHFDLRDFKNPIKKSLVPVGDVKEYHHQIERTLGQGGSLLDTLAFEIKYLTRPEERSPKNLYSYQPVITAKLLAPKGYERILTDFIRGEYEYVAGKGQARDKQAIRGARPLLELPFLRLKDEAQIKKELNLILEKGETYDDAKEQIEKMARNAYSHGANNRAYRSGKDSVLGLVVQIAKFLRKKEDKHSFLPEFAYPNQLNLQSKVVSTLEEKLSQYRVSSENFHRDYTKDGILFHGTSSTNALSILRNGFLVSNANQGVATFGPGVYTTSNEETAKTYGDFVISLPIKKLNLRIINWEKVDLSLKTELEKEANTRSYAHVFDMLKIEFGVDAVINTYVIVLNPNIIKWPKDITNYLQALIHKRPNLSNEKDFQKLKNELEENQKIMFLWEFIEGKNDKNNFTHFLLNQFKEIELLFEKNSKENSREFLGLASFFSDALPLNKMFFLYETLEPTMQSSITRSLTFKLIDTPKNVFLDLFPMIIKSSLMKNIFFDEEIKDYIERNLDVDEITKFIIPSILENINSVQDYYVFHKLLSQHIQNHASLDQIIKHAVPKVPAYCEEILSYSKNFLARIDILDYAILIGEIEQYKKDINKVLIGRSLSHFKPMTLATLMADRDSKFEKALSYKSTIILNMLGDAVEQIIAKDKGDFWSNEPAVMALIDNLKSKNLFTESIRLSILHHVAGKPAIIKNVPEFLYRILKERITWSLGSVEENFLDLLKLEKQISLDKWNANWKLADLVNEIQLSLAELNYPNLEKLESSIKSAKIEAGTEGIKLLSELDKIVKEKRVIHDEKVAHDNEIAAQKQKEMNLLGAELEAWETKILQGQDMCAEDEYFELAKKNLSEEEFNAWQDCRKRWYECIRIDFDIEF